MVLDNLCQPAQPGAQNRSSAGKRFDDTHRKTFIECAGNNDEPRAFDCFDDFRMRQPSTKTDSRQLQFASSSFERGALGTLSHDMQGVRRAKRFPCIQQDPQTFIFDETSDKYSVLTRARPFAWVGIRKVRLHHEFVSWKSSRNKLFFRKLR